MRWIRERQFDVNAHAQHEVRESLETAYLKEAILDHLTYSVGKARKFATLFDYYQAVALVVRDRLMRRWVRTLETYFSSDEKAVCYFSAEYLPGRHLENNLASLELNNHIEQALASLGIRLDDVLEEEAEPGLGNGGLGRLASCFMDSLATLKIPAVGYGIRYEYGIFRQLIVNSEQQEVPDHWLQFGNPWEFVRPEQTVRVGFGGKVESYADDHGSYRAKWQPSAVVIGTPYDTLIPGYRCNNVNTLRLWGASSSESLDLQSFNQGNYFGAVTSAIACETISKVLYPNDHSLEGKKLRLQQQYFFVACSLWDICRTFGFTRTSAQHIPSRVAIQLNDTHPAIAVAELLRLLIDYYELTWDDAWKITEQTFAFTNHTLLSEALEVWPEWLITELLPRHAQLLREIDRRFHEQLEKTSPALLDTFPEVSLFQSWHGQDAVRMAHLACIASKHINGVAALHSTLMVDSVFKPLAKVFPDRFLNVTNGITFRRWLGLANPSLCSIIAQEIGSDWLQDSEQLRRLEFVSSNSDFQSRWYKVKQDNKIRLAEHLKAKLGISVPTNALYDVQVKRIHEYKRQLLFALYVIARHQALSRGELLDAPPRVCFVGGKAASSYHIAKQVIHLIGRVGNVINTSPTNALLQLHFLPNFNVSLGEKVYPAADLSEQISMAGKEASGTGNMKFALNGAYTIGTLDGANIEIRDQVGSKHFFQFGLTVEEVKSLDATGYNPSQYLDTSPRLREAVHALISGEFTNGDCSTFRDLHTVLTQYDSYKVLADFDSYWAAQTKVDEHYRNTTAWIEGSICNTARIAYFSSDRAISEYCEKIWRVKPLDVTIEA
jgi:glycogen phosphorylase